MPQRLNKFDTKIWLAYIILALFIIGLLLKSGYIFTFDMVFAPTIHLPGQVSNLYPLDSFIHILNYILPSQIIEKLIIFIILLFSGIGMHRLIVTKSIWPKYFAGVLYVVNPFTYERWMAGQYLVLAGYALLPFLLKSLINFVTNPNRKNSIYVAVWFVAISLVSIHTLALSIILGLIFIAGHIIAKPKGKGYRQKLIGYSALFALLTITGNSFWLISTIKGSSSVAQTLNHISSLDFTAFTTSSGQHLGVFANVATMYSFWMERFHRYAMPNANIFLWLILFAAIFALVIAGVRTRLREVKVEAICLIIVAIFAFIIACGVDAPLTGHFTRWFITHVPFMKGFREPEKFSALLILAYCYFAGYGVEWLIEKLKSHSKSLQEWVPRALILLPLLYTSTMLFGFAGQLKALDYPQSWYSFNNSLKAQPAKGRILFLPWHEYMSYDFTPRIIANPAPQFFSGNVIAGSNAEFGEVYDAVPTPTSRFIEKDFLGHTNETGLGHKLTTINVQYVLLSQGYDHAKYGFLDKQTDLKLVSDKPGLRVYLNTAYGAK